MWDAEAKTLIDRRLNALKPFDPFNSSFCTCGSKLTLNIYNGCGNECFYCYASAYSRGRWGYDKTTWGLRRDVVAHVGRDIEKIHAGESDTLAALRGAHVAVSLSSDPYPNAKHVKESELGATRECLRLLTQGGFRILLQTKSDLVVRDLDVLEPSQTLIGMTITTDNDDLAAKMEPRAPSPSKRIDGLRRCSAAGFATVCRVDPLIPGLNSTAADVGRLVATLAEAGVRQIISSTFKMKADSAARFEERFGRAARTAAKQYEDRRTEGYRYLRRKHRGELMTMVRDLAHRHGMAFSCCREGLNLSDAVACDARQVLAEGTGEQ